jgi:alpha-1,3-rhamnosyl/mannosyltransferase
VSEALVVAVEASRLAREVRGIGREVWALLPRLLRQRPSLRLVLCGVRRADEGGIRRRLAALGAPVDRVAFHPSRALGRVHADLCWFPWNVSAGAPRRGPVVVTMNDVAPVALPDPRRRKFLKNLRWRRRFRATARRATLLLAISEFTRDEIERVLGVPRERIRVTLLAADDLPIPPASRDAEALARLGVRAPYLLVVGAADRRKNIAVLERAMARLLVRHPEATLVFAGPRRGTPSQPEPGWRRTLGFVSDDDLVSLYRGARALLAPSSYEGFGLPVLEAMRLGTPVICARASSLPEVAGDAAAYVAPGDDAAFAELAAEVLEDDALHARMRAAGLARGACFSWERTAHATLEAFDEALSLAGSAAPA